MFKNFLKYVIPSIVANIMQSLYCVIDAYFLGIKTGDLGLASLNLAWPIAAFLIAVGIGVGTGGAVLISNYLGKGEEKKSRIIEKQTLLLLLISSIVFTIIFIATKNILLPVLGAEGENLYYANRYITILILGSVFTIFGSGMLPILRNRGKSTVFMIIMTCSIILNVIGDYLLIFVFNLGINGAALATIFSQGISAVLSLIVLSKENNKHKMHIIFKEFTEKWYFPKIISISISPLVIYFAPSLALIITNIQCLNYGNQSVVAAYATITYLTFPLQRVVGGIAEGSQPIFSFYFGKGDFTYIKKLKKLCYTSSLIFGVVIAVTILLINRPLGIMFGISQEAVGYFVDGMNIMSTIFLCIGFIKVVQAFLFATLNEKKSAALLFIESFAVAPALLIILPIFFGINGIWLATALTPYIMSIFCFLTIKKVSKKIELTANSQAKLTTNN